MLGSNKMYTPTAVFVHNEIMYGFLLGNSTFVHQSLHMTPSELDEISCVGSPGGHMCPKGISPSLLVHMYGFPAMAH